MMLSASQTIVSNGRIMVELETTWKQAVMAQLISCISPGETKENHEKIQAG
jgi:hypothetical protein